MRLSSLALHFLPHTHPPDIHVIGTACLEYQGSLVSTYCTFDLRSIPLGRQKPAALFRSFTVFNAYGPAPLLCVQKILDTLDDDTELF